MYVDKSIYYKFLGSSREGSRMWFLGTRVEGVAVLHERDHTPAGEVAGQPAVATIWGPTLEGRGQDGDETESGESLWSGVESSCK